MKAIVMILLLFMAFCQKSPDEFTINLDLPPHERYRNLAKAKQKNIIKFLDFLHTDTKYKIAFKTARTLTPFLKFFVGKQFYEQCRGIAITIKRPVSELIVFNYMYELGAYSDFCTSIAVQDDPQGFFLARNLDYGFQQFLADNSVKLTYLKGSKAIFQTIGHAGMIGAHTGLRMDGYSVTLNQRIDKGLHITLEQILIKRSANVPYLLQQTLRTAGTIDEAYSRLLNTRVTAAVYFILNGPNRNILIEKQRVGVKAVYEDNTFIVQTNTDRDQPDPDTRRDVAEAKMALIKKNSSISRQNVWNILTAPPNMNKLTLITVLLDTSRNQLHATVWQ